MRSRSPPGNAHASGKASWPHASHSRYPKAVASFFALNPSVPPCEMELAVPSSLEGRRGESLKAQEALGCPSDGGRRKGQEKMVLRAGLD